MVDGREAEKEVMRVLFVNTNTIKPPIAPLAIDYIAAVLQADGHDVRLLDLCWAHDAQRAVAEAVAGDNIDLAAVTFRNTDDCYFASGCSFVPALREDLAMLRKQFDGPIVLGGGGFSLMPVPLLDSAGGDFGVRGEGELAMPALIRAIEGNIPLAEVPGLVYKENGKWRENRVQATDLHTMSLSPRNAIDNRRYFLKGGQAGIETKRGCSGRCVYCADPVIKGNRPRLRSPSDVVAEMRNLLAQGVDHFHLCDSEFNLPEHHAFEVCKAVIDAGLGDRVRWYTYASPVPISRELIVLMQRAGCAGINFGVDNGSDRMLKALARNFASSDIRETARLCRDARLVFMFDLLLGSPGETRGSVEQTIELVKSASPSCVGVSVGVRVYPGTPLVDRLEALDTATDNTMGELSGVEPVFYVSRALGDNPLEMVREIIGDDPRFFVPVGKDEHDYNYNDNAVLQEAIDSGHRGAYWDILRRIRAGE